MKIDRRLIALGVLLFVVGITGRHIYKSASQLRSETPQTGKASVSEERPVAVAVPFEAAIPVTDNPEVEVSPQTENITHTPRAAEHRPEQASPAKPNGGTRNPAPSVDLSRYRVRARQASRGDYLPDDDSMTPEQMKENVNRQNSGRTDWGNGLVGDIARGAQKLIRDADDATLDSSRKVLGSLASPDSAKIRPYSDGVRLHIDIPTR